MVTAGGDRRWCQGYDAWSRDLLHCTGTVHDHGPRGTERDHNRATTQALVEREVGGREVGVALVLVLVLAQQVTGLVLFDDQRVTRAEERVGTGSHHDRVLAVRGEHDQRSTRRAMRSHPHPTDVDARLTQLRQLGLPTSVVTDDAAQRDVRTGEGGSGSLGWNPGHPGSRWVPRPRPSPARRAAFGQDRRVLVDATDDQHRSHDAQPPSSRRTGTTRHDGHRFRTRIGKQQRPPSQAVETLQPLTRTLGGPRPATLPRPDRRRAAPAPRGQLGLRQPGSRAAAPAERRAGHPAARPTGPAREAARGPAPGPAWGPGGRVPGPGPGWRRDQARRRTPTPSGWRARLPPTWTAGPGSAQPPTSAVAADSGQPVRHPSAPGLPVVDRVLQHRDPVGDLARRQLVREPQAPQPPGRRTPPPDPGGAAGMGSAHVAPSSAACSGVHRASLRRRPTPAPGPVVRREGPPARGFGLRSLPSDGRGGRAGGRFVLSDRADLRGRC